MRDIDQEERLGKLYRRVGEWLAGLSHGMGAGSLPGGEVTSWRFKMATEDDPMTLLIVKATATTGDWIAFVGAPSVCGALLAWRAREAGAGLKWKADRPWADRVGE